MPTNHPHSIELARRMIASRQFDAALRILGESLDSSTRTTAHWETQGMAYYALRKFGLAQSALESASLTGPLGAEAQYILADCYDRLGSPLAAACIYEFLSTRTQQVPLSLLPGLAAKLGGLKKYHLALQVCRRASELLPECEQAAYGVAYYMGKAGFPPERVIPVLRRVVDLAPDVAKYRWALAQALHQAGNSAAAYGLMAGIEVSDVAQMCCQDCVRRLWKIFEEVGDYRRCDWCRARLQALEESETP